MGKLAQLELTGCCAAKTVDGELNESGKTDRDEHDEDAWTLGEQFQEVGEH